VVAFVPVLQSAENTKQYSPEHGGGGGGGDGFLV
jgi:hypothetical protein